ncbi:MAG TPA: hypothetical protein VF058_03395, partial [Actinomycetota bacterium]
PPPAPAGRRYFAQIRTDLPEPHTETVDVVVDEAASIVRVHIATGTTDLLLAPEGDILAGTSNGEPIELPWGPDRHLDYLSPVFNAISAARLDGTAEIDVLYLDPVTCEPRDMVQRYEWLGTERIATPVGAFEAGAWRYTAVASGFSRRLWVAGDLVVAYETVFELIEYEPGQTGPFPSA